MCYTLAMKTQRIFSPNRLSDDALVSRVKQLAAREREVTVTLIAHLAELDARRLYLAEGCSSLFTYCTQVLHLSEHAAYGRIEAARAARRYPIILELLEGGAITLTTVCLLAAHLTADNHRKVLDAARHRSKRQVEELVARLHPQPPVPSSVRRLPAPRPSSEPATAQAGGKEEAAGADALLSLEDPAPAPAPAPRSAVVQPLAPERYRVQFTASAEMYEKLRLAQALLRHQIPNGDPAAIFERALTMLLESLTKQKLAATDRTRTPRSKSAQPPQPARPGADSAPSRHIPAETKRAVWRRDGGRCAFVSSSGRRCAEDGFLQFHHVVPYSAGGVATVGNIQLRCRAHNSFEGPGGTRSRPSSADAMKGRAPDSDVDQQRVVGEHHIEPFRAQLLLEPFPVVV